MYDILLTEGDLRNLLQEIEQKRQSEGKAYCLQIHLETRPGNVSLFMKNTIEELRGDMIAEMFEKGHLKFLQEK